MEWVPGPLILKHCVLRGLGFGDQALPPAAGRVYAGDISLVDSMVTVKITNAHSCPPRNSPSGRLSCRYTPMCVKQSVYLVVPAVLSVLKRLGIASVTIHRQLAKAGHEMPCGHKKVKKWGLPWCSGV